MCQALTQSSAFMNLFNSHDHKENQALFSFPFPRGGLVRHPKGNTTDTKHEADNRIEGTKRGQVGIRKAVQTKAFFHFDPNGGI